MIKHNQDGAVNGLALSLGFAVILLIAAIAFGGWAFSSRQDYKDNSDAKAAAAVTVAKQAEAKAKDIQFAEDVKQPLRTYTGPESYGSIVLKYPKSWSGYVADTGSTSTNPVDGYFYPNIVPSITNPASSFALRVQVINQSYADVLKTLASQQTSSQSSQGQTPLVITPYALPKVPKTVGIKASGSLTSTKVGTMVVLPLRTTTLEVWTEGTQYTNDFNNNILPNLTFSP
jgi:hypothetical protein